MKCFSFSCSLSRAFGAFSEIEMQIFAIAIYQSGIAYAICDCVEFKFRLEAL